MEQKTPKGETDPDNIFDIVPKLLGDKKWFDVSLDTILAMIRDGKRVDLRTVHVTSDQNTGEELKLPLRLRISGRPPDSEGWHISLLLYNRRIDGFGYEERFRGTDGIEHHGWHRHVWNPNSQDAASKTPVSLFDGGTMSFRDFLIRGLKEMKISYPKDDDYANPTLF